MAPNLAHSYYNCSFIMKPSYMPCHEKFGPNHWITVTNIGCISSHIKVYDSIPSGNISSRAIQEICAMIFSDAKEITLNFPPVQSQRGGSDCGLFAIAFATTLCTGFDPVHLLYNQHRTASTKDASLNFHAQCLKDSVYSPFLL